MSAPVLALLLADSRTPSGGYAHSAGLEPAVAAGLRAADVPAFLAARLETVAAVDAAFAAAACAVQREERTFAVARQHRTGGDAAVALALALDDELAARTPGAPQRAAARSLGRALLRLGRRLLPDDPLLHAYAAASEWTPRAVVFGLLAGAVGLTPAEAARLSLYEDAAGVAAAAVKLLPVDAGETMAWVASAAGRIEELAAGAAREAARCTADASGSAGRAARAASLPATSTPLLDLRALLHEHTEGRLFVS